MYAESCHELQHHFAHEPCVPELLGGQFRTVTCRQIRMAHSSVCQGSHTLAHPSDLRLGKGCKTLLSLSQSRGLTLLKMHPLTSSPKLLIRRSETRTAVHLGHSTVQVRQQSRGTPTRSPTCETPEIRPKCLPVDGRLRI